MPTPDKDQSIGQMLSASEIDRQRQKNADIPVDEPTASVQMPRYKCHKEVWALKLGGVGPAEPDGSAWLYPTDMGYAPFLAPADYMKKHQPYVGGYYVVYKDGYRSFSPADVFEDGYTRV